MSDPSQNQPYTFFPRPVEQDQPEQPIAVAVEAAPPVLESPAITGEVLPPEAPAPETPPSVPQYPIGLIDFNQPIVVIDNNGYNDDEYDSSAVVTVLKGSLHPVVVSFWKHGEQCVAQFDTDGDSSCGDYKVEQDQPYPRTVYVVIGRDGRNLVVDDELYASEDAARAETNLGDVAGVFPVVVEAKVEEATVSFDDNHVGAIDGIESEEDDNEVAGTDQPVAAPDAPTEMYVAGRNRRVGETVHAYRQNFGTRACRIVKLRRDSRKSLYLDPQDGNGPYWALNKNVRY